MVLMENELIIELILFESEMKQATQNNYAKKKQATYSDSSLHFLFQPPYGESVKFWIEKLKCLHKIIEEVTDVIN